MKNVLTVKTQDNVHLPSSEARQCYSVRRLDWQRFKRNLDRVATRHREFELWWALCFGFAAPTLISVIPLAIATDVPAWVVPAYLISAIAATLIGLVLRRMGKQDKSASSQTCTDVLEDMADTERSFGAPEEDLPAGPAQ